MSYKETHKIENEYIDENLTLQRVSNTLINVIGGQDFEENYRRIALTMSSVGFRFPEPNNHIFSPGIEFDYYVEDDDEVVVYPIDCTDLSIESITAGTTSGCTYKIKPTGEVKQIDEETSTAIFGSDTYTHCAIIMVLLPSDDYWNMTVAFDSGAAREITEDDVLSGVDADAFILPIGLYDDNGTTKGSCTTYTITHNGYSLKNEFDFSGVTLES